VTAPTTVAPSLPPGPRGVVLVVDDEPVVRRVARGVLEADGHEVLEVASAAEARAVLEGEDAPPIDAVLLDVMMPGESGVTLLADLRERFPHLPIVMATASGDVHHVVAALRSRAFDYLLKPIAAADLRQTMRNAVARAQATRELAVRRLLDPAPLGTTKAVFAGPAMRAVLTILDQVKDSATPVLVLGESGTGKEVVARELHARGTRARGPFVAVNCAALPLSLVESELFGYEKGAFTGAVARKKGRFEEAAGGTLFLDEVGELDVSIQAKLLRVLQEREIPRLGGAPIKSECRVVFATHRDLRADVRAGKFREDLYYRISVIVVRLPPLRERREELPFLAAHLLARIAEEEHVPTKHLTPEAMTALVARPLRGNVREVENILRRSVLLSPKTELDVSDLVFGEDDDPADDPGAAATPVRRPGAASQAAGQAEQGHEPSADAARARTTDADPEHEPDEAGVRPLRETEKHMMLRALAQTSGSVTEAARLLGIGRTTFYRRAKKFDLPL
jgi:DNA-binding NtrC family response regulator